MWTFIKILFFIGLGIFLFLFVIACISSAVGSADEKSGTPELERELQEYEHQKSEEQKNRQPKSFSCANGMMFSVICPNWTSSDHSHYYCVCVNGIYRAIYNATDAYAAAKEFARNQRTTLVSAPQPGSSAGGDSSGSVSPALAEAYKTLGVAPAVTDDEVKEAYHTICRQYHPDLLSGLNVPPQFIQLANEIQQAANKAYELIKRERGNI